MALFSRGLIEPAIPMRHGKPPEGQTTREAAIVLCQSQRLERFDTTTVR